MRQHDTTGGVIERFALREPVRAELLEKIGDGNATSLK
jgi:hypothetical protein